MEKELLNKFFQTMLDILQDAKSFMEKEIPLVCQEILKYNLYKSVIYSSLCGIAMSLTIYFSYKLFKFVAKDSPGDEAIPIFIGGFVSVFLLIGTISNALEAIQIIVAPRIYLIEYFANLVKQHH